MSFQKVKADQKYFTAMKAKDAIQQESRLLKVQHSKSSEIITQLKDAEKTLTSSCVWGRFCDVEGTVTACLFEG